MKFKVDGGALLRALANNVCQRSTLPILDHLLLDARTGCVYVNSTDMERSVRVMLDAEVEREGVSTVEVSKFKALLQAWEGAAGVELKNGHIWLTGTGRRFRLNTLDPQQWPTADEFARREQYAVDADVFRAALGRVAYAVPSSDGRICLNGIHFKSDVMTATNGHRLARVKSGVNVGEREFILPHSALKMLPKAIEEGMALTLEFDDAESVRRVSFGTDRCVFSSLVIDAPYVNADNTIPDKARMEVVKFPAHDAMLCVQRVRATKLGSEQMVGVALSTENGLLNFAIGDDAADWCDAHMDTDLSEKHGFCTDYLLDVFKLDPGAEITWYVGASNGSHLFSIAELDDLHIIMPMRI